MQPTTYDPTKQSSTSSNNFKTLLNQKLNTIGGGASATNVAASANFNRNFDIQSNRTGRSGGGFNNFSNNGVDNNLTEMMLLSQQQQPAEVVRQQYIEEPSFRRSLFKAPEDHSGEVEKKEISAKMCMIMIVVSFLCFGTCTITFKAIYLNHRHTVWEDIYGRGVGFFACSVIHYLVQRGPMSIFDLRKSIRMSFFSRVLLISMAYIFLFLAIQNASSFLYVALILCLLPPICKVLQRYAMIDKKYAFWDLLVMISAIIGMGFVFKGNSHFINKNKYIPDDDFAYDNL